MAKPKLSSLVVFGVDLGTPHDCLATPEVRRVARELASALNRRQIAATWALPDYDAALIDTIRQSGETNHEMGLLTDSLSIETVADAFQYSATLRFQVEKFRAAGITLRSIAADPAGRLPYHTLGKLGFQTLRPTRYRSTKQVRSVQPEALRYGLWGVAVSSFWPHQSRLMQPFLRRNLQQQMHYAATHGKALHVVIDAMQATKGATTSLERMLDSVSELRAECGLKVGRLADVAQMVRQNTAAKPGRSILRAA